MILWIKIYVASWLILSLFWAALLFRERKHTVIFTKQYATFLLEKWKVATFFISVSVLCYISKLGYDPTWDIPETIVMGILTYYTAPYSVGILYRWFKWLHIGWVEPCIALILIFFCSAWLYDAYVWLFLLGEYPITAFSNLWISPFFYVFAGMMWNLIYVEDEWVSFSFTHKKWIDSAHVPSPFFKLLPHLFPIMLFMVIIFWYFIYLNQN